MRFVDLFAGAGGFSVGFEQAGFKAVMANDIDWRALNTYELNHSEDVKLMQMSCSDLVGWLKQMGGSDVLSSALPDAEVVIGGPPCQPFSHLNVSKRDDDDRVECWADFLRVVKQVDPVVWVMENVKGFKETPAFSIMRDHCRGGNIRLWAEPEWAWLDQYFLSVWILWAQDYGCPQSRRRLFMVGSKQPIPGPPPPVGPASLRKAIGGVGKCRAKPGMPSILRSEDLHYDFTGEQVRSLLSHIPPGGCWMDIPTHVGLADGFAEKFGNDRSAFERLTWDKVSRAVTSNPTVMAVAALFHPEENRYLTLYERALIQTFPEDFRWYGTSTTALSTQIGNAVPPRLAYHVAQHLRQHLF